MLEQVGGSWRHSHDPGEAATGKPRLSVTDEEAEILAWLARGLTVLEIGTGLGHSTRALASTARHVHTIDPDPWVAEQIAPTLPANVTHHASRIDGTFHLAFIDGDHRARQVRRDVRYALARCTQLLVAHDAGEPRVLAALEEAGSWAVLPTEHGLGLLWRPTASAAGGPPLPSPPTDGATW